MSYTIAGIDIHKKVVMVVATDVTVEGEWLLQSARFGTTAQERQHLVEWLRERGVQEVVMESTAQYWKPVWLELEPHVGRLHLAQAHSNRAPKGRKHDFGDAERLVRRLVAGELRLSFVPDAEQRQWRGMEYGKL
jgi:transposase